jgi:hypothetical protein
LRFPKVFYKFLTSFIIFLMVLFFFTKSTFAEPILFANSPDLKLKFYLSSAQWCGETVSFSTIGVPPDAHGKLFEKYQQTAGRLRGAVEMECPKVKRIIIESSNLVHDEMLKIGKWRVIRVSSLNEICKSKALSEIEPKCEVADFYNHVVSTLIAEGIENIEITAFPSDTKDISFQWQAAPNIEGKVTLMPISPHAPESMSPTSMERWINRQILTKCAEYGSDIKIYDEKRTSNSAWSGSTCSNTVAGTGIDQTIHTIVSRMNDYNIIYTISNEGKNTEATNNASKEIYNRI